MQPMRRRDPFKIILVVSGTVIGIVIFILAAVIASLVVRTNHDTHEAQAAAGAYLAELHADDLGHMLGTGEYGTTALGDPPTAFIAVELGDPSNAVLNEVGSRLETSGFIVRFKCNDLTGCTWERGSDGLRAQAYVLGAGASWGRKSTDHGVVSPGARVLVIEITQG